jgi:hypothetical protein
MAANDAAALHGPVAETEVEARLSVDIAHLREENRRLHGDLARLMEERNRLLRKQAESARGRSSNGSRVLEERLVEARAEISEMKGQRRGQDDQLKFLTERMEEAAPIPRLFLERLQGLASMAGCESGAAVETPEDLSEICERFNATMEDLWRLLDGEGVTEHCSLRDRLGRLQGVVETQRKDLAALRGGKEDLTRELDAMELSLQQALSDGGLCDTRVKELQVRILELEEENVRLSKGNLNLKGRVKNLRQAMDPEMFSSAADVGERVAPDVSERKGWGPGRQVGVGILLGAAVASGILSQVQLRTPPPSGAAAAVAADRRPLAPTSPSAKARHALVSPPRSATPPKPEPAARPDGRVDVLGGGLPGPELVVLTGSRFTMGTDRYAAPGIERPARAVRVKDFLIGRYEVTFAQYDAFARASGRPLPDDEGWGRGSRPVINVTWEDANAYTGWLSQRSGKRYRLPSEVEWEYAMSGGSTGAYWWGNGRPEGREVCLDCGTRWDGRGTAPVGSAVPNPRGLYDMGGNVMEWTADCMAAKEGFDGSCATRAVRGGAFNRPDDTVTSTARRGLQPGYRYEMVGFRVARER